MYRRRNQNTRNQSGSGNPSNQKPRKSTASPMATPALSSYEEEQRQFHLQQQKLEQSNSPASTGGNVNPNHVKKKPSPNQTGGSTEKVNRPQKSRTAPQRGRHSGPKPARRKDEALSYYVYGKAAAIEFVCDETRKQQIQTITMQAAIAKDTEERGYEWGQKTSIQIPRNELLQVVAIMLGKLERAEFHHNTQYITKSYMIEHQGAKVYIVVTEKGKAVRAVGLSPDDTYQIVSLFLRQLKSNASWMTVSEIISLIDQTVVSMREHSSNETTDAENDVPAPAPKIESNAKVVEKAPVTKETEKSAVTAEAKVAVAEELEMEETVKVKAKAVKPKTVKTKAVKAKAVKPKVVKAKTVKTKAVKAKTVRTKAVKAKAAKPKTVKAKTVKAKAKAVTKKAQMKPAEPAEEAVQKDLSLGNEAFVDDAYEDYNE